MNDRENQNQGRQGQPGQQQNTGAGSRQQEQANAGGSMREDEEQFGDRSHQMEQQSGTYRPEGDRGVDFESDGSGELGMGQAEQQSGRQGQDGESDRSRQQEQSESDRSRRGNQQGEWDSEDEDI